MSWFRVIGEYMSQVDSILRVNVNLTQIFSNYCESLVEFYLRQWLKFLGQNDSISSSSAGVSQVLRFSAVSLACPSFSFVAKSFPRLVPIVRPHHSHRVTSVKSSLSLSLSLFSPQRSLLFFSDLERAVLCLLFFCSKVYLQVCLVFSWPSFGTVRALLSAIINWVF